LGKTCAECATAPLCVGIWAGLELVSCVRARVSSLSSARLATAPSPCLEWRRSDRQGHRPPDAQTNWRVSSCFLSVCVAPPLASLLLRLLPQPKGNSSEAEDKAKGAGAGDGENKSELLGNATKSRAASHVRHADSDILSSFLLCPFLSVLLLPDGGRGIPDAGGEPADSGEERNTTMSPQSRCSSSGLPSQQPTVARVSSLCVSSPLLSVMGGPIGNRRRQGELWVAGCRGRSSRIDCTDLSFPRWALDGPTAEK